MKRNDFLSMLGFSIGALSLASCGNDNFSPISATLKNSNVMLDNINDLKAQLIDFKYKFNLEAKKYPNSTPENSIYNDKNFSEVIEKLYPNKNSNVAKRISEMNSFSNIEESAKNENIFSIKNKESLISNKYLKSIPNIGKHATKFKAELENNLKQMVKTESDLNSGNFKDIFNKSYNSLKDNYTKDKNLKLDETKALDGFGFYNETFPDHFPLIMESFSKKAFELYKKDTQINSTNGTNSWSSFWSVVVGALAVIAVIGVIVFVAATIVELAAGEILIYALGTAGEIWWGVTASLGLYVAGVGFGWYVLHNITPEP